MLKLFTKVFFFFAFASFVFADDSEKSVHSDTQEPVYSEIHPNKQAEIKAGIREDIAHHLRDDYYFTLWSSHHKPVGFPLPIVLFDDGLKVFSSAKFFDNDEKLAEIDGNYYKIHHSKIYKADASGIVDEVNKPLDFSITKTVAGILLTMLIMLLVFGGMAKSYAKNKGLPTGMGRFLEPLVLYIRDDIAIPNIGEVKYKKYMPFLLTVFFFIWILNLLGLTPLGLNVTGNIAITFSLAIFTFIITQFTATKDYWMHIFWMPGVPVLMRPFLALIELLGLVIKPFSLMIRLYANISAGHIVLMSIIGMMFLFKNWIGGTLSFSLAFALSILELLVAALQAYIFTMLSALYFGQASEEHAH